MRFSKYNLLLLWETGLRQHPIDRALTILAMVFPELSWDQLTELSIGQRDGLLFKVREQMFGPLLTGLSGCLGCQEQLEFVIDTTTLDYNHSEKNLEQSRSVTINVFELIFRLPNSRDLAAIVKSKHLKEARNLLVKRCVLEARQNEIEILAEALPDEVIISLGEKLVECDPLSEVQLNLNCPMCGNCWQVIFDISSYLWTEISVQAKRLFQEVHILARAYGWSEADILSMSTTRRQFYLEMVNSE